MIYVYLAVLAPETPALARHGFETLLLTLGIVAVSAASGLILFLRLNGPLYQSLLHGQPVSGARRQTLLSNSIRVAGFSLTNWLIASAIFGLYDGLALHEGLSDAFRLALSVALGGLTTAALVYLLNERALRSAYAIAFEHEAPSGVTGLGLEYRLDLAWALGAGIPVLSIALAFLGRDSLDYDIIRRTVLVAAGISILTGALIARLMARSFVAPLSEVRHAMARVQTGDLDAKVAVDDLSEIGLLQVGFNEMVTGLQQRALLEDLFGRHVGLEVAHQALVRGTKLQGEAREVSVLFVDVIGSTAMAVSRPAEDVFKLLNEVFAVVVHQVTAHGGWVNKFEGDAALCVFGAPGDLTDHASRALLTAQALRGALDQLGRRHAGLDAGIGVSSGVVVAGNIGAEQRFEYVLVGDTVNEAARLTELAKRVPARVLAGQSTVDLSGPNAREWIYAGEATLRGRSDSTRYFAPPNSRVAYD
ncbi:MAG TPA: adenylate/guanylate cyclase domain-containing protein [Acidimicrobiales bacterium]|nr:adenylate/guanylate cyclase domain-containing protein [Acidimicrobiales bacterium]